MGSRASKLKPTAELPPALRPICRKIEEAKKRRRKRSRRYSIVSSTELLDDRDNIEAGNGSSREAEGPEEACAAPARLLKVEEEVQYLTSDEGPEKVVTKKQTETAVDEEDGRKLRAVTARRGTGGEELPGSPSFRIYFPGPIRDMDDEPAIFEQPNKKDELSKISKTVVAHRRAHSNSNSNEDSESKQRQQKKAARMRKWRVITKANMALLHMVKVQGCHSNPSSMEAKHGSSRLLFGKAA